jgi:hypothetical protein
LDDAGIDLIIPSSRDGRPLGQAFNGLTGINVLKGGRSIVHITKPSKPGEFPVLDRQLEYLETNQSFREQFSSLFSVIETQDKDVVYSAIPKTTTWAQPENSSKILGAIGSENHGQPLNARQTFVTDSNTTGVGGRAIGASYVKTFSSDDRKMTFVQVFFPKAEESGTKKQILMSLFIPNHFELVDIFFINGIRFLVHLKSLNGDGNWVSSYVLEQLQFSGGEPIMRAVQFSEDQIYTSPFAAFESKDPEDQSTRRHNPSLLYGSLGPRKYYSLELGVGETEVAIHEESRLEYNTPPVRVYSRAQGSLYAHWADRPNNKLILLTGPEEIHGVSPTNQTKQKQRSLALQLTKIQMHSNQKPTTSNGSIKVSTSIAENDSHSSFYHRREVC